jgi:ABC-type antimicrobial peptide transport system permease subunit
MKIPLSYSLRNLWTRRLTTVFTVTGMALVVFVFAAILMLAAGLRKSLVQTGSHDNVVVIRKAAGSEVQSGISRDAAAIVEAWQGIAPGPDGRRMAAKEMVALINLPKRGSGRPGQVVLRGITGTSILLRPQAVLSRGRLPRPGTSELMAGINIAKRFGGAGLGETLHFNTREWQIVGVFDAGSTGFSSEIWGDVDQLMQSFRRQGYSSVIFKLADSRAFGEVKAGIEGDPRLVLEARRETKYYADQSEMLAKFLEILGLSLTVIFSVGAVIGAMITMYAAVANRTAEIGTLRSLGFQRRSILAAFLAESLLLGFIGGCAGLFFASFLQFYTISTINFQTFSELAFSFTLTPGIILRAMAFSLLMGLVGGLLPAFRAARMNIVDALRTG